METMPATSNPDHAHGLMRHWLARAFVVLLLVAFGAAGWVLYCGVTTSIQAEHNLHAATFTMILVEQFVAERGRWPKSWKELENFSPNLTEYGSGMYGSNWPADSAAVRQRVEIDFQADVREILQQDARDFSAIKPIGPYYGYLGGTLRPLQAAIERTIPDADK